MDGNIYIYIYISTKNVSEISRKKYYNDENTYIISGHTPTAIIREDKLPLVNEKNGHIAIDCGCVFGGRLAVYCLDTGEVYYVEGDK